MELIEREEFLSSLQSQFEKTIKGKGHCIFICGEAGIGKTSLVKAFCEVIEDEAAIYTGTCDTLFTPRPLAPLYDIAWQMKKDLWGDAKSIEDRGNLFTRFFNELSGQQRIVLIFEDIHWADEATLDFIKFFSRRIMHTSCLFILTYRDNEIHSRHPLRNVLGELIPGSFTRMQLTLLSKHAVEKLALEKGYSGENVYSISGGNPFYVTEILASYSPGVPDNIKDSILLVYNRQDEKARYILEILSILPTGLEIGYLEKIEPGYMDALEYCLDSRILIINNGLIHFKHELYRRTIEESLSPFKRMALNKKILDLFRKEFEDNNQAERIIHHAKNANDYLLVVQFAPVAAKKAASVGAHVEAAKLYLSAIQFYQGNDKDLLLEFYEYYAYECYLTNNIKEAIIYQGKSLNIYKHKNDPGKMGNSLRFLSRLWWFDGNHEQAEQRAREAIEVLDNQPLSRIKAMAYSNMSQLKMLSDQAVECLYWGEKAILIARELNDEEILSHAMNNVGTELAKVESTRKEGMEMLNQSLAIALKNSYHEHVARAYTNIGYKELEAKEYIPARETLANGIHYCEERDLDSWAKYMLSSKAKLELETGDWNAAYNIADRLLKNENQAPVVKIIALTVMAVLKMRKGEEGALSLFREVKASAFDTMELQRIVPVLVGLLEYEWLTGENYIEPGELHRAINLIENTSNIFQHSELAFWLMKVRKQHLPLPELFAGYNITSETASRKAAVLWGKLGCLYEQALILFDGNEEDKRKALTIVHELGAAAVYEKMKQEMRGSGIKRIPRGIRETTRSNPAQLTSRELDVLALLKQGLQNKEIASKLFISAKTVDHHISSILFKLEVNSRTKAVQEAIRLGAIK